MDQTIEKQERRRRYSGAPGIIYRSGITDGTKAERERIWNSLASELIVYSSITLEQVKSIIFKDKNEY